MTPLSETMQKSKKTPRKVTNFMGNRSKKGTQRPLSEGPAQRNWSDCCSRAAVDLHEAMDTTQVQLSGPEIGPKSARNRGF